MNLLRIPFPNNHVQLITASFNGSANARSSGAQKRCLHYTDGVERFFKMVLLIIIIRLRCQASAFYEIFMALFSLYRDRCERNGVINPFEKHARNIHIYWRGKIESQHLQRYF